MNRRHVVAAAAFLAAMGGASALSEVLKPTVFLADQKPPLQLQAIFPSAFGHWQIDPNIIPLEPSPDLQKALEESYSETLSRTYVRPDGTRIMLSVAYGRNQHKGMNWHRPEICYPAQGLPVTVATTRTALRFMDREIPLNRLVTGNASRNEPISYWVIVGDRITSFGRAHKLIALSYGVRGLIPDGMLVRVSSITRDNDQGFRDQEAFIRDLLGAMSPANRDVVLGTKPPFVTGDVMPAATQ
jgi:EpsI family protein